MGRVPCGRRSYTQLTPLAMCRLITVLEAGFRSALWGIRVCSIFNGWRKQPALICIEHLELARSRTQNGHRDFDFQNKTHSAGR